VEIQKEILTN